jgi:hypothetical protein
MRWRSMRQEPQALGRQKARGDKEPDQGLRTRHRIIASISRNRSRQVGYEVSRWRAPGNPYPFELPRRQITIFTSTIPLLSKTESQCWCFKCCEPIHERLGPEPLS